ncbi:Atp-binding protein, partial [Globisporangium polare]
MAAQALLDEQPKRYGSIPKKDGDGSAAAHDKQSFASASWWSKLFFSYANPVMALGNTRQLNQDDLWQLEGENKTGAAYQTFKKQYLEHDKSVVRALLTTYGWHFFLCGVGSLVMAVCSVFAPLVLHHVIDAFSAPVVDMDDLVLWLGAFFVSRLVNAMVKAHIQFHLEIVMIRLTVSLKSLIFEKAMRRSVQSKHEANSIEISNLFTSDMTNFIWLSYSFNALWILPIQISLVVYMLYWVLGVAAFAGAGVMALSLVLNSLISKSIMGSYKGIMEMRDNRMKTVKEAFGAIQIVKFNAWEGNFFARIQKWRAQEMKHVALFSYMVALVMFLTWSTPIFVSLASFATYTLVLRRTLTASTVFTSMMLFNAVTQSLADFPEAVQLLMQTRISLGRVGKYLDSSEIDRSRISSNSLGYSPQVMAALEDVTLSWAAGGDKTKDAEVRATEEMDVSEAFAASDSPVLSNVSFQVKKGDFVVVHGAVGAGKSSLCSALL